MNYPGEQVTAPADQRRRYQSGQRAYVPVQGTTDDDPDEFAPADGGGYQPPARSGRARHASTGYAPAARNEPARQANVPSSPANGYTRPPATDYGRPPVTGYVPPAQNGYARPAAPANAPSPATGYVPRARNGHAPAASPGKAASPGNGSSRPDSSGNAGRPDATNVPGPRQGYARHASVGYLPRPDAPQDGNGYQPARRPIRPASGPAESGSRPAESGPRTAQAGPRTAQAGPRTAQAGPRTAQAGPRTAEPRPRLAEPGPRALQSRRGPAYGYPPMPDDLGPRYPQPEFSAWNESAAPAPRVADDLPFSAPTWSDTGNALTRPGPGAGTALADRADEDLATLAGELAEVADDDPAAWTADVDAEATSYPADSYPAASPGTDKREAEAEHEAALAELEARLSEPDAAPLPDTGTGRTARRTRAAAASARKAARQKGRTRRRVMVAGVCLPAIAVVAVMAYAHHPGGQASPNPSVSHSLSAALSVSPPSSSMGTWQHIGTRAEDPAPLTLGQLFPAQFAAGKASYTRTAQLGSTDCARAVFGPRLQAAVRKNGCTQVMRASYLAQAQKLMGTIGVLNLASSTGANKVGKVAGSSQFIAQLTAATGPTHRLTRGTGLEEAEVKGHYLILTWVEFTTLRAPKTASERAQLKAFSADLINRTANVSLTSRMVIGKPQFP